MADFKTALARTSRFEGGYQCKIDDNGNWTGAKKGVGRLVGTKFGITAWELQAFLKREPTVEDMKNLSRDDAETIYYHNYWMPIRGNEIVDQDSANQIYDMGVNGGVGMAIILAHRGVDLPDSSKMTDELLKKLNNRA